MKINERGYWENETSEGHGTDSNLAKGIYQFFKNDYDFDRLYYDIDIVDIGCGDGLYTNYLRACGISCIGYDGNPNTEKLAGEYCKVLDFSIPQKLSGFDWVISLETGEHIPSKFENIFIDNLVNNCIEGMIISWAIPGQGGDGHVNCRTNEYIRNKICSHGFKYDVNSTMFLRDSASPYPKVGYWFKDTLMVFRRF